MSLKVGAHHQTITGYCSIVQPIPAYSKGDPIYFERAIQYFQTMTTPPSATIRVTSTPVEAVLQDGLRSPSEINSKCRINYFLKTLKVADKVV